ALVASKSPTAGEASAVKCEERVVSRRDGETPTGGGVDLREVEIRDRVRNQAIVEGNGLEDGAGAETK
ncbi:hypothetical protein LINPERPRIM_LOCUS18006, partial [Linum perenne]